MAMKLRCRTCRRRYQLQPDQKRYEDCPGCRSALGKRNASVTNGKRRLKKEAELKARVDSLLETRRQQPSAGRTAPLPEPAPTLLPDLDELIRQADAASERALKAAADPTHIEPRETAPAPLDLDEKLELVMLYGDVPVSARNRWLLERGRRTYVDYFADAEAAGLDRNDREMLGRMLGLYSDVDEPDDLLGDPEDE